MATLAVRKGVLTSPGATGDQTVSLSTGGSWPASTTPKAVILWTSYATAAGQSGISAQWSHGFGTNDAAAVQNAFVNWNSLDGALSGAPSWGCNTTFILRGMTPSTTGTTEDYAATLVSLGSDQFVINWSNLPATASIKVHYLALGGDALSRARVFSFTGNNAATHDITVVAGGGQPKVVFIAGGGGSGLTNGASGAGNCGIGVGLLDGTSRCSWIWQEDAVAAMNVYLRQINEMIVARGVATAGSTVIDQATMSSSSHPTDGFELTNSNAFANSYVGLALYGTDLEVALGTLDSSTSTNGTDTISLGTGDAEAAFVWGGNMPTSASDISADNTALLGAWGIGAADSDGNEGYAAIATDDAAADEQSGQTYSETKGIQSINPGATPALLGEADLTMSGSTLTATWTDADNVSREKNVLLLGAVGASGTTYEKAGTATTGTTAFGTDVFEATETGKAVADTVLSGADVFEATEAGTGLAGSKATGTDVFEATETGKATSAALATGASQKSFIYEKTGTAASGTIAKATDVFEATETGTATAATKATGADLSEFTETGTATADTTATGPDVSEFTENGTATAGSIARGSAQAGFTSKLGTATTTSLASGADVFTATESGAAVSITIATGTGDWTAARTGTATSRALATGTSQKVSPTTYQKTGTATAGALATGADAYTATEAGTATSRATATGTGIGTPAIPRWNVDSETRWPPDTDDRWAESSQGRWGGDTSVRWEVDPETRWEPVS
jgi:hypothetical protein